MCVFSKTFGQNWAFDGTCFQYQLYTWFHLLQWSICVFRDAAQCTQTKPKTKQKHLNKLMFLRCNQCCLSISSNLSEHSPVTSVIKQIHQSSLDIFYFQIIFCQLWRSVFLKYSDQVPRNPLTHFPSLFWWSIWTSADYFDQLFGDKCTEVMICNWCIKYVGNLQMKRQDCPANLTVLFHSF